MKKLLSVLLAICMCLSLALLFTACDENPTNHSQPAQDPEEGQTFLNGVPLEQYVIVYPEGDSDMEAAARYFAAYAKTDFSLEMQIMSDQQSPAEYEILLGNTNRDTSSVQDITLTKNDFLIAPLEEKIWISGENIYEAIDYFSSFSVKDGDDTCLNLFAPQKGRPSSIVRVMTYNVQGGTNHTTRDFEKINMLLDLIEKYEPDIFGVQEATPNWMSSLHERFGDRYDSVGVGRYAGGSGEASAIFYRKDRFEILDNVTGTRWLSDTPDEPGSRLSYSEYVRIYTYAKFKDKQTGKVFLHANTHLDLNDIACEDQAEILTNELKPYKDQGLTLIVTGDYNCRKTDFAYTIMTNERWGGFSDSLDVADETLNGSDSMIDHIFLSEEVDVLYYQVCTETYTRANGEVVQPSDHRPVFIDCVLP